MARQESGVPEPRILPKRTTDAPVDNTDLPAVGHKRDEELLKRTDILEQQASKLEQQLEISKIDPKNYEPDPEILKHYKDGDFPVTRKDDNYVYCWTYRDPNNRLGSRQVMAKKIQGWETVQGEMKESLECRHVDGTRIIGDTLLMRIRLDRYMKIIKERDEINDKRSLGVTSVLQEMGANAQRKGLGVRIHQYTDNASLRREINMSHAKDQSTKQTDEWIRSEKGMPGVPVPRG